MALVCRYVGILNVDVVFFQSPDLLHSQDSFPSTFREPLQRTHLQRALLRMSPTAGDETSRGRNPENGRRRDFGRRRHRHSGFQHTYRLRPSSQELFNKARCLLCESSERLQQNFGRTPLSLVTQTATFIFEFHHSHSTALKT